MVRDIKNYLGIVRALPVHSWLHSRRVVRPNTWWPKRVFRTLPCGSVFAKIWDMKGVRTRVVFLLCSKVSGFRCWIRLRLLFTVHLFAPCHASVSGHSILLLSMMNWLRSSVAFFFPGPRPSPVSNSSSDCQAWRPFLSGYCFDPNFFSVLSATAPFGRQ